MGTSSIWRSVGIAVVAMGCWTATEAAAPAPGLNAVPLRGQQQEVHYLPARGTSLHHSILYLPGVGGWEGWAITVAETMASWGYDVYGVDTKRYLDSFTTASSTLTETDVMDDMRAMVSGPPSSQASRSRWWGGPKARGLASLERRQNATRRSSTGWSRSGSPIAT